MSMRGSKRPTGPLRPDEAGASKRRKTEEDALWQLRPVSDLKMSSIYNRSATEAPAELFRKDLISAMKLPDSEPLTSHEYWIITDTWKQEWERGVQVPVNPDSLPAPAVKEIPNPLPPNFQQFKLPKNKYIHLARDAFYQPEIHQLSTAATRAEAACKYDLDATDSAWLRILNGERARAGASAITEEQLERVIQELEVRCWDKIQAIMKSEEGLGIEYDENVICDVCRSPDSEEGNEMVFCDMCNICVHQACYGITTIPSGQWLCRPCGDGTRPTCVLCPNLGGAMKCTPSGHKWAHVSCVLWIPEVSIGCAERMEPITKISSIPSSRWSLVCVLCRERKGACIQCSVKSCKTAYHVTCAFKHGLEMRAIIEDENADDGVKLRSYCQKHSVNSKKEKSAGSGSEEDEVKKKRRKEMTSEEKSQARAQRLREIEGEFDKHVSIKDISTHLLDVDQEAIGYIYSYWKLKRRAGHNRALLPPKADDSDILCHRQEQADLDKMKMFVQLRQDLERVRNLCYMVSRREKLSRSFFRMREQTFHKQVAVLSEDADLSAPVIAAVIEANHGPSIYDKLYSHPEATDNANNFETMMARIAGLDSEEDTKKDFNGLIKSVKSSANPYKKVYVNGSTRRSGSMFSGMSSEESAPDVARGSKYRCRTIGSSTEEDEKPSMSPKKKVSPPISKEKPPSKVERKKRLPTSRNVIDSSSEEDVKPITKKGKSSIRSQTLKALEREMSVRPSGTDSDDLMPMRVSRNIKFPVDIYSDSSEASNPTRVEDFKEDRSPNATNDSQQQLPRTKAAMKQFIPMQKSENEDVGLIKRNRKPSSSKEKLEDTDDDAKNKENVTVSKSKDCTTELIVPQRQAAKKASENMRSTTKLKDTEIPSDSKPPIVEENKLKTKPKLKAKEKEIPPKDQSRKKNVSADSSDLEKDDKDSLDLIAYVPQRQAAKKAAAHIKSGLGSKMSNSESNEDAAKKKEVDITKRSPKKEDDKQSKASSRSSSSSSSNSSSSTCSSSSSSEEDDDKSASSKSRELKQLPLRQQSLFSPPAPRPSVDLPFLDKVSRPLSSTSASSDSDSAKESRGSGSCSPIPKRPRPRRHESSSVSDEYSHKAPDKKLKTSEWRSECRVPSPTAEGEERNRAVDARASSRPRPRSTASSGNLFNKRDTGPRKSLTDESDHPHAKTKSSKETNKSSELPFTQWKKDEALNLKKTGSKRLAMNQTIDDNRSEKTTTLASIDGEDSPMLKPIKSQKITDKSERRLSIPERRISTKTSFSPMKESNDSNLKELKSNKTDYSKSPVTRNKGYSPNKSFVSDTGIQKYSEDMSLIVIDDSLKSDEHKSWYSINKTNPNPTHQPPLVERYEDTEKYINEDKSQDSDSADKISLKVMAKIQANLENTMIKSPKTPMDATTNMDIMDVETPSLESKVTIHSSSTEEIEKNVNVGADKANDSSSVHAIETFKTADSHKKAPTGGNTVYPKGSIFSPQPTLKDTPCNDLFEFGNNILAVDDSVSDEIMKPFSFNTEFLFKEDSKEDRGVQETRNLVEKLRMTLISKKSVTEDTDQDNSDPQRDDKEAFGHPDNTSKIVIDKEAENSPSPVESICDAEKSQPSVVSVAASNDSPEEIPQEQSILEQPQFGTPQVTEEDNANKWRDIPLPPAEPPSHMDSHLNMKYEIKPYEEHPQYHHHAMGRRDMVRQFMERHERELLERERHEMERQEIARHEMERQEIARHEMENQEIARHEMENEEIARHEMENQEILRHENERREMERHEMHRHEMGRLELERQRMERRSIDRHEMERHEMDRREMERREMERCEMERQERDILMRERNEMERQEMERHEMQRHDIERQEIEKHSATSHDLQATADNENFQDNVSKQSDDSRSIMEQSMNSNDHDTLMQDSIRSQQSYDNNNSLPQSDCATTSSPYREGDRSERKWGESKITQRRSSASSTNSDGSVCSQKMQIKPHIPNRAHPPGIMQEMEYANMPPYPCPPMESLPYNSFSSEASPFVAHATVSLFQPGPSSQLPLQSPGAGLYPPNLGIPYSSTSIIPPLSKSFNTMCAAFATTSQNMTLNTPNITPAAKPMEQSPRDDMDLSTEKSFSVQTSPTPSGDSFNDASSGRCVISKLSNESNDTICTQSTLESRSSTKPIRTSTRFAGQGKSPGKSPGFSPKRPDSVKSNASKRSSSSKNSRGRGRGRSRTRGAPPAHGYTTGNVDYLGNSIHSKLVGTVYELDFDEETANDGVDLKAMRERRRSIDVHDRKSENSFKDSSQSPRVPSPITHANKRVTAVTEPKETRPPSPTRVVHKSVEGSPQSKASSERAQFPAIVQPVLPGPVDMRRYQPIETPTLAREPFNSHLLGSFETVTAHQPLVEIDEDNDHTNMMVVNPDGSPTKSPVPEVIEPPITFTPEVPMPKVSLSDSRNQLKVKIKGPFRDANYCSVQPVVPQPPQPVYEPPPGILGAPSAVASVTSAMLTGTSNLRRMRKKELLRQYWTQDMNMDDPAANSSMCSVPVPVQQPPLNRTIITIPKAVASMTTIPTREDYKAVVDANMEKKKRKTTGERELRHLQVTMNDDLDNSDDFSIPSFTGSLIQAASRKGRGRVASAKPNKVVPATPVAPKLKIKIGSNIIQPVPAEEPSSGFQFRPPKKRLAPKEVVPPTLSYEDVRRESMKFRKLMMADFGEGKKEKKHKPKSEKSEKRKKKKGKKSEKMQVVNSKSDSVTKLVIKITRNKEESSASRVGASGPLPPPTPAPAVAPSADPFEYDPSAPDPLAIDTPSYSESCAMRKVRTSKVTPIRLKLARSAEGSGYVMKDSVVASGSSVAVDADASRPPLPVSKHCQVR